LDIICQVTTKCATVPKSKLFHQLNAPLVVITSVLMVLKQHGPICLHQAFLLTLNPRSCRRD